MLYLSSWQEEYNDNKKPIDENNWNLTLHFENEEYIYRGYDSYPKVWVLFEKILNKYVDYVRYK